MLSNQFEHLFQELTGNRPFPWQTRLYKEYFSQELIPSACSIPTGLGKTSVIVVWLIALAEGAQLPRRLVYVVNRRTVVDQTTREAEELRQAVVEGKLPSLRGQKLSISTLRGQFADNRDWSADPSRPAIICGTVDMIGSRLLFSGYGLGFKGKPLHAGFLGQDSLIVHDEAHLEPAFQELLERVEQEQHQGRFPDRRPLRVMQLTATPRHGGGAFELSNEEQHPDPTRSDATEELQTVWQRTTAAKALSLHAVENEKQQLADRLVELALAHKDSGRAILLFVRTVEDLGKVVAKLPTDRTSQLTGTMRGFERDKLISDKVFARFLPDSEATDPTVYLVCTSAGEVGVNLSADHLVCDLSTFESMAQRLGRVNRFGSRDDTRIDVVYPASFDQGDKLSPTRQRTLELLQRLNGDASPRALSALDPGDRSDAYSPLPRRLPVTDILFDAWSLTSVIGPLPGRPIVAPYLHGIADWEPPQTKVAWREEVAVVTGLLLEDYPPQELLECLPLKPFELLADRSNRVFDTLKKLTAHGETPVWLVQDEGSVEVSTLAKITAADKSKIEGITLLLPPEAGGLNDKGLLSPLAMQDEGIPYDVSCVPPVEGESLRYREWSGEGEEAPATPKGMKKVMEVTIPDPEDEDAPPIKTWQWFVRVSATDADARSRTSYGLQLHLEDARELAEGFVKRLPLDREHQEAIVVAAKFHDLGKDRERWQRGIGNRNYPSVKWAKSGGRRGHRERAPYRHEFGSLLDVREQPEFQTLSEPMKDLVLHLIAAHHGRARPHFTPEESLDLDAPHEVIDQELIEVPRRFARLQRTYGRWGLAYLESLVRAADYAASAKAEENQGVVE